MNQNGQDMTMTKTSDNYWLLQSGGGSPFSFPASVTITSIFGASVTDTVPNGPVGTFIGGAQFPLDARFGTVGSGASQLRGALLL